MSRNLKRVPLDFEWPIGKVWPGYVNQHGDAIVDCDACDHSGYAPDAKRFHEEWYGDAPFDPVTYGATPLTIDHPVVQEIAERNVRRAPEFYIGPNGRSHLASADTPASRVVKLTVKREALRLFQLWRGMWSHHLIQADVDALVAANRLPEFTHVPITDEQHAVVKAKVAAGGNSWLPEQNGYRPTADEVNAWSLRSMGHGLINCNIVIRARCGREGVPVTCAKCGGHGYVWASDDARAKYEAWKPTDPPAGEGFQLWEDCSEGSPNSPVFATLKDLCAWCEKNATTFANFKATAAEWERMLLDGRVGHQEGNEFFT
jgi:hypothetical protein